MAMAIGKRSKLSWRGQVKLLLRESGSTQSELAHQLDAYPATVNRILNGSGRPKVATVSSVNRATARLVAAQIRSADQSEPPEDRVFGYLTAVAERQFGDSGEAAEQGLALALRFIAGYASPQVIERLISVVRERAAREQSKKLAPSDRATMKLGLDLLVEIRRMLLDMARLINTTESRFDRVAEIFASFDASLRGALEPEPRAEVLEIPLLRTLLCSVRQVAVSVCAGPRRAPEVANRVGRCP